MARSMRRKIAFLAAVIALSPGSAAAGLQLPGLPGKPEPIGRITFSDSAIAGDGKVAAWVKLSSAATTSLTFNLTSSDPSVASFSAATVTIQPSESSSPRFFINTSRVTQNTSVLVTASYQKAKLTRSLAVTVRVDGITLVPPVINSTLTAGAVGTLAMSGAPSAGSWATLSSSNPQVLRFGSGPFATAAGTASVNLTGLVPGFSIVGASVDAPVTVTIRATYNGVTVAKNVAVTTTPGP